MRRTLAGRYEFLAEIGGGGFGGVWRARDTLLARDVAVKLLRPDLGEEARPAERFMREARALAAVKSRHVPAIFDVGTTSDGELYLVMELLAGRTVTEKLDDGPMDVAAAVRVGLQVARALELAHAHGIVHKDIKTDNVMLVDDDVERDSARLIDFGIAHVMGHERLSGRMVVGTLSVMAPEQVRGDAVTPSTDVYGVGGLLYRMIAGPVFPHATTLARLLDAVTRERPASMRARRPEVAPSLDALALRCLEKEPGMRPRDMAALVGALERELSAPGAGAPGETPRPRPADGADRVRIPWGTFLFGSEERSGGDFRIDRAPVTRAQFTRYAEGSGRPLPSLWAQVPGGPNDVAVGVAAEEADAYAAWVGARLPTAEEWEQAARSGQLLDVGVVWEWTSTLLGGLGRVVRGGPWRDRPTPPTRKGTAVSRPRAGGSLENESWEIRAAKDVGFRTVVDDDPTT